MRGILPLLGWAIMWAIGGYSLVAGLGPRQQLPRRGGCPVSTGTSAARSCWRRGRLVLGIVLMLVYAAVAPPFFRGEVLNAGTATLVPEDIGVPVGLFGVDEEAEPAQTDARRPLPGAYAGRPGPHLGPALALGPGLDRARGLAAGPVVGSVSCWLGPCLAGRGRDFPAGGGGGPVGGHGHGRTPTPAGSGRPGQGVDLRTVHGLLGHQQLHQPVEHVAVGLQDLDGPLLGLSQQAGDLGVDGGLGGFGEGPAGELAAPAAEEHRAARAGSRPGRGSADRPNSRTILVARSVALARSLAAPVEPWPSTTSSPARPPRNTASMSWR